MANLRKKINFYIILEISSIFVGVIMALYYFYPVFASPPATMYAPGETTNPTCSPGDPNCSVYPPLTTTLTTSTAITMGTSSLNFDSGTFFIDAANNKIGIGTTTPSSALSVVGDINTTGAYYISGVNYSQFFIDSQGTVGQLWQSDGSGRGAWINTSTLGFASGFISLQSTTTGTQQIGHFNISGTGIVGTSFGVGTSTVSSTLTVQGTGGINIFDVVSSSGVSILRITSNGNIGIGTSTPSQRLSVSGNISNIIDAGTPISQIATTSVAGVQPWSIFVSGRYAYVANKTSNSISVLDVSNPTAPVLIATTSIDALARSIFVSGRYAYTANSGSAVHTISVIDISNPKAPIQIATTPVGVNPYSVYVSGRYAYTANFGDNSISVVDVSNPKAPVQIATTSVGSGPAVNLCLRPLRLCGQQHRQYFFCRRYFQPHSPGSDCHHFRWRKS